MSKLTKTQVNKLVTATRTAIGNADKAQMPVADLFAQLFNGYARYIEKSADFTDFWRNTVGVSADTFKLARGARESLMIATPDATLQHHLVMTGASIGTVSQERNKLQDAHTVTFTASGAGGRPRTEDTRSDVEIKRDRTARALKSLPTEMQDEVVSQALSRSPEKRTDVTRTNPSLHAVTDADALDALLRQAGATAVMESLARISATDDKFKSAAISGMLALADTPNTPVKVTVPKQSAPKPTRTRPASRKPAKVS